jgi:hypothetical protein
MDQGISLALAAIAIFAAAPISLPILGAAACSASTAISAARAGVFTEQIPTEGNQWSGLGGLWTTPQLMQALERAAGVPQEGTEIWGVAGKVLRFLSAKAKLNRVAMNPDSTAINLLGGVSMMLANGDWYSGAVFRRLNESIRLRTGLQNLPVTLLCH